MTAPIRVLLADDHPLVRTGLRATLAAVPDIVLVGEATDGDQAQQLCQALRPDVLVLDLQMPGPLPTATVTFVHACCPGIHVLVLTGHDEDVYVRGLVAAGVAGYILKGEAPEVLVHAIRSVVRGGTWFSQPIVRTLLQQTRPDQAAAPELTDRERQLLRLLLQGADNARIAATLHLGEQTVRSYLSRLYTKLGVHTRSAAIIWARDHRFV